jgi:hypothetical protein
MSFGAVKSDASLLISPACSLLDGALDFGSGADQAL